VTAGNLGRHPLPRWRRGRKEPICVGQGVLERDPQSRGALRPAAIAGRAHQGRAVDAGAGALHLHPRRSDGSETLGARGVGVAIEAVPVACPNVLIGVSTGSWIEPDVERRVRLLSTWGSLPPESRPDFASVNPWGGAGDGPKDRAAAGRSRREDAPPLARRRSRRLADARVRAGTWLRRPYRTRRHVDDARRQFLPETMLNWLMRRWSRPPDRSGRPAVEARLAKRKRPANEQEAYDAEGR
jgi:hypothetical protein